MKVKHLPPLKHTHFIALVGRQSVALEAHTLHNSPGRTSVSGTALTSWV